MGNAISIDTQGKTHIYFANRKEHYYFTCPKSKLHNLIFGKMWIEHYGELNITNLKNGDNCTVTFKKCGFFSSSVDYKLEGSIRDSDGNLCVELEGNWDEYFQGTWCVDTKETSKDSTKELWRVYESNFINDKYHFSKFTKRLIEVESKKDILPPTDTRLRLDIIQLQNENPEQASRYKKMMEERQRQEKKRRETNGEEWVPTYFHKNPEEDGSFIWVYSGDYWEQREQKQLKLEAGEDVSDTLNGGNSKDTASDFKSYDL